MSEKEQMEALRGDLQVSKEESEDVVGGRAATEGPARKKKSKKGVRGAAKSSSPDLTEATRKKLTPL